MPCGEHQRSVAVLVLCVPVWRWVLPQEQVKDLKKAMGNREYQWRITAILFADIDYGWILRENLGDLARLIIAHSIE